MRFVEFKTFLREANQAVVVIGDSIAVGIGGASQYAEGGISTVEVLKRVNAFIRTGKAKGATVILSSGASNSSPIELEGGIKKPGNGGLTPVEQQLVALQKAGANVALVGTGSKKSKPFPGTTWTGGKKYMVDLTGVNERLEAMAASTGATFLGPLEDYDPGMHSGKGDGIHPYAGYGKLLSAGSNIAKTNTVGKDVVNQAPKVSTNKLEIPNGRVGVEVADIQQILLALGYALPKHGVDGVRGPETSAAVKQFQRDNGLKVDGDPGPETVGALNKLISEKNIKFTKSTDADVKKQNATAFTGDNPKTSLKMDSVTEGMVGQVLDFVAKYESSGFYDIMFGGKRYPKILEMTLQELYAFTLQHGKRTGSSAAGRYQIMHFNIKPYARKAGLDYNTDLFSPENQDKMGIVFLRECGLDSWLRGKLSNEKFLDKIAMVWAAFAKSDGSSPYNKVGHNGIGLSPKISLAALNDIQNTTA
jgi:peptidoglycan hydrolase-like protein with peptidoglycan-binding domain